MAYFSPTDKGAIMKYSKLSIAFLGLFAASTASFDAAAVPIVFSGSSGNLSANVSFDIVNAGTQLQVVLTNTSTADVLTPTDALTAVFFNIAGDPALTRDSAISGGPTYLGATDISGAGTVVGGEWAYLNGLNQYGVNSAISSVGLGVFGPSDLFPGANLAGPPSGSPDGLQYGLASAGDIQTTGNGGVSGNELTKNSVTFLLSGIGSLSLSDISGVTFQYGTNLSETSFPGDGGPPSQEIPEPGTLALLGLGLLGFGASRRYKKKK
jgi:hypothetical protein